MSEASPKVVSSCGETHVQKHDSADALLALKDAGKHLRVAIIHDWLVVMGGAEKVLGALLAAFPQAELFTMVDFMPDDQRAMLAGHHIHTSMLQKLPFVKSHYRHYLPLMPYAVEQFDLRGFDLVISSSHAVAKGVMTQPGQLHVCYCHTPMRYAWDMKETYLEDAKFRLPFMEGMVRRTLHRMRQWDYVSAGQVDHFIANSYNVSKRIKKYYRRQASIIHPSVDLEAFDVSSEERQEYYVAASRLVPYKRIDLVVEAFLETPWRTLVVAGDGPEYKRLLALAGNASNIEIRGYLPGSELKRLLARAKGYIFAADEDFGILPLEAQACGTPVIAYGNGGALETVRGGESDPEATGCFFDEQTVASLLSAIEHFESRSFSAVACRNNAAGFSQDVFWDRLHRQLAACLPTLEFKE